jgi:branched-subunit amino acid transport protein AzlD
MAQRSTGYGRKWKKRLVIYVAAGTIAYLVFFTRGGGGGVY